MELNIFYASRIYLLVVQYIEQSMKSFRTKILGEMTSMLERNNSES